MNFTIKVAEPKKKRSNGYTRQSNKIVCGIVIDVKGTYKVRIEQDDNNPIILDFTPDSYEIEGRRRVFRLLEDKWCCVIRDRYKARHFPGLTEQYIPFRPGWKVKGYIVKNNIARLFKFKDLVGVGDYVIPKEEFI